MCRQFRIETGQAHVLAARRGQCRVELGERGLTGVDAVIARARLHGDVRLRDHNPPATDATGLLAVFRDPTARQLGRRLDGVRLEESDVRRFTSPIEDGEPSPTVEGSSHLEVVPA